MDLGLSILLSQTKEVQGLPCTDKMHYSTIGLPNVMGKMSQLNLLSCLILLSAPE